jgi:hypothetical protein
MVVDASAPITIRVLANAYAHIDAIRQLDVNSGIWYSLFPEGEQGYCNANTTAFINLRLKNTGSAAGNVYLKITRGDNGAIVWNQSYNLAINAYVDIDQISFVMPYTDLALTFEVGHT